MTMGCNAAVLYFWGFKSLFYLFAGSILGGGTTAVAAAVQTAVTATAGGSSARRASSWAEVSYPASEPGRATP